MDQDQGELERDLFKWKRREIVARSSFLAGRVIFAGNRLHFS
jgi:hypothetical protein